MALGERRELRGLFEFSISLNCKLYGKYLLGYKMSI